MGEVLENIYAVGFDLDGTLYPVVQEIDNRLRTNISKKILEKLPGMRTLKATRIFFEERYMETQSGTQILKEVGYENSGEIMSECLTSAEDMNLIPEDPNLGPLMEDIHNSFETYLITSSPMNSALRKLDRLGVNLSVFDIALFNDFPFRDAKRTGEAFRYILDRIHIENPHYHVYVGDRLKADVLRAKEAGMRTIAIGSKIPEADLSLESIHGLRGVLLDA